MLCLGRLRGTIQRLAPRPKHFPSLVRARVLARLATALHALSVDQEAHFVRESTEIGRMVGGWLRAEPHPYRVFHAR